MEATVVIVFLVIFYFVFSFIWKNTKTISFNGLSGFLDSWISQIVWAAIISGFATAFLVGGVAEAGNSLGRFLRSLDFYDIAGLIFLIYFIYSAFTEDNFDRKTFRKNFNSKVNELLANTPVLPWLSESNIYQPSGNKDELLLDLPEEFISTGDSKLQCFPGWSMKNVVSEKINRIRFSFDFVKPGEIGDDEEGFSEIIITAMIESVTAGKSKEIKSALKLIDSYEIFGLPPVDHMAGVEVDGVTYNFFKNATGMFFSLTKQIKSSEGK